MDGCHKQGGNGFMGVMPEWNDAVNLPHAPPGLTIDYQSGIVTWMNGIDITTADADGNQAAAGFYNLVVMVEERKFGLNLDTPETRDPGALKIPIDFLLYLYPQVHFCNMDCAVGDEDDANVVQVSASAYFPQGEWAGCYTTCYSHIRLCSSSHRRDGRDDWLRRAGDAGPGNSPLSSVRCA
jgi:hypothetical protein